MKHYYETVQGWFNGKKENIYTEAVKTFDSGKFVEVGCWKGRSLSYLGVEIINSGKNIKVDAVDTFTASGENDSTISGINTYSEFINNIQPVISVVENIRQMKSEDASKLYLNESLEMVFIDGGHKYNEVMKDIECWWPKIKKGGMLCGDDYSDNWVVVAVDQFFGKNSVKVYNRHWRVDKK